MCCYAACRRVYLVWQLASAPLVLPLPTMPDISDLLTLQVLLKRSAKLSYPKRGLLTSLATPNEACQQAPTNPKPYTLATPNEPYTSTSKP